MSADANVFPMLQTERLVLREVQAKDAKDMFTYLSDKEVMKYFGLAPFQTITEVIAEISWYQSILQKGTGIRWGITLKGEDKMIGSCGFHNKVPKHYRSEIGIELSRDYWKQGIAEEALKAVLQYGFEQMQLERIEALIEPPNKPSQRLVEKQGFTKEGLLRSYEFTCGKFDDLYMYSLLKGDRKH